MHFWHNTPLYNEIKVFLIEASTTTFNERAVKWAVPRARLVSMTLLIIPTNSPLKTKDKNKYKYSHSSS